MTKLNTREALDKLNEKTITTSQQMLRRWIRQGKIKATLHSKKEGYIIDSDSLNQFTEQKERTRKIEKDPIQTIQEEYNRGWQTGYTQAKKQ